MHVFDQILHSSVFTVKQALTNVLQEDIENSRTNNTSLFRTENESEDDKQCLILLFFCYLITLMAKQTLNIWNNFFKEEND